MSKDVTIQDVADYFDCQFTVALHLAKNPHDFQVFLNLVEEIKKALTTDMIDETEVLALNTLYKNFVMENTDYTAAELESMGLLNTEGENYGSS